MLTEATSTAAARPLWVGCCPVFPLSQAMHAATTPATPRRRQRSPPTAAHLHRRHVGHLYWNPVMSHAMPSHAPVEPEADAHGSEAVAPVERRQVEQPAAHCGNPAEGDLRERLQRETASRRVEPHGVSGGVNGPARDTENGVVE